jgi:MerR family transcriptional regulator, light-induced transcriptional regulator
MNDPNEMVDRLAHRAIEEHRRERPEVFAAYRGKGDHCIRDTKYHLNFLFDAALIDSPQLFINYVAWAKVLLSHINIPPIIFRENLEHIRNVCQKELEGQFLKKTDIIMQAALDEFEAMPEVVPTFIGTGLKTGRLAAQYLDKVLAYDRQEANAIVKSALENGMELKELYLNVFQPVQHEIGRLWQHRIISVAQEHFASGVTQQLMSQIYLNIIAKRSVKGVLIVTCVNNELHEMGARMVSDFLEMDGWDVRYLGSNTPTNAVISALKQGKAIGLFISATMGFNVTKVRSMVEEVRDDPSLNDIKIVVGGYPFNTVDDLWRLVGADLYARDAAEAVVIANGSIR